MEQSHVEREDDHMVVVIKRKRTKRSRQTFSANTASSCSNGSRNVGGGGGGGGGEGSEISTCTDDDEDMANCLILLAQSGHENTNMKRDRSSIQTEGHEKIITSGGRSSIQIEGVRITTPQIEGDEDNLKLRKSSSKRFCEVITTSINVGKASVYGYECKTCNRIFSSFQALGGHRASHRKDWPSKAAPPPPLPPPLPCSSETEGIQRKEDKQLVQRTIAKHTFGHGHVKNSPPTIVTNLSRIFRQKNEKVHECTICSAEFPSGQALGGHMRKHRNIPLNVTKKSCNNNTTESCHSDNDDGGERSRSVLELDLNLPAPKEDDDHDSQNFQFSVLSFPALVDCQY